MKFSLVSCAAVAALTATCFCATARAADCLTPPAPGEVILYRYGGRFGGCIRVTTDAGRVADLSTRIYVEGLKPGVNPLPLPTWDNKIGSVWLGLATRVSLYKNKNFGGLRADYLGAPWGNYQWYDVANPGDASSLVVSRTFPSPIPFVYAGEYPTKTGKGWSFQVQGIAHDANKLYLTRTSQIFAVPQDLDLGTLGDYYYQDASGRFFTTMSSCTSASGGQGSTCTLVNQLPPSVRVYEIDTLARAVTGKYNHFGDPDFWNGYLFVPVESDSEVPLVAVFDDQLRLVAWDWLTAARPDANRRYHASFLTVSTPGQLITSGPELDASNGLQKYQLNAAEIPGNGWFIQSLGEQLLYRIDPTVADGSPTGPLVPVVLDIPQGGDLSDWDEDLIYISNGCCAHTSGLPWGVRAFHLSSGEEQVASANGYGAFNYAIGTFEEPEGVDFFDTNAASTALPGFPASQLHVLLTSDVPPTAKLKHYAF